VKFELIHNQILFFRFLKVPARRTGVTNPCCKNLIKSKWVADPLQRPLEYGGLIIDFYFIGYPF
jgi:hypothetical protein